MSFFNRIFTRQRTVPSPQNIGDLDQSSETTTKEHARLKTFTLSLKAILETDKYLARSDYRQIVDDYSELNNFFQNQKAAKTLNYYCSVNNVPNTDVERFLRIYADIANLELGADCIRQHNQIFIQKHMESEKDYLDNILKSVDPAISLDAE